MRRSPDPTWSRLLRVVWVSLVGCGVASCLFQPDPLLWLAWEPLLAMISAAYVLDWIPRRFRLGLSRVGDQKDEELLLGVPLKPRGHLAYGGVLVLALVPLVFYLALERPGPPPPARAMVAPLPGLVPARAAILTDQPAWVAWYADRPAVGLFREQEDWEKVERTAGPLDAAYVPSCEQLTQAILFPIMSKILGEEVIPMLSPFPGMDPYLEHPVLWSGVHQALITYTQAALNAALPLHYVADVGERLYVVHRERSIYPDVVVLEHPLAQRPIDRGLGGTSVAVAVESDPFWVLTVEPVEIREVFIEILSVADESRVVTVIEVLSPSNKTEGSPRATTLPDQTAGSPGEPDAPDRDRPAAARGAYHRPAPGVAAQEGPVELLGEPASRRAGGALRGLAHHAAAAAAAHSRPPGRR
jgi:hypothetical protein